MQEIKIKNFGTEMEAILAKNMLQFHDIKSRVQNRGMHSSGIPIDRFGADLFVLEKDVERALELLK